MFEKQLAADLRKIFGVEKVTLSAPGESREQHCLFVEVESSIGWTRDARAYAKVTGNVVMFARGEQIPFGFFTKAISRAAAVDLKKFFFFDFEDNQRLEVDLVQRGFSFVYFYDEEYDPEVGQITSVTFIVEDT